MSHFQKSSAQLWDYFICIASVLLVTGIIGITPGADHTANVSLLYLLVVMGAAHWFGRGPAVLTSLLAVLSFDWFFVEPRHTFTVTKPAEWLTLSVFLLTATVINHLTTTLRLHAREAHQRERQTAALAKAGWAIASQLRHREALAEVLRRVSEVAGGGTAVLMVPAETDFYEVITSQSESMGPSQLLPPFLKGQEQTVKHLIADQSHVTASNDLQQLNPTTYYLRLTLENHILGVLYLHLGENQSLTPEQRLVVESLANLAAVSLERSRLTRAEAQGQALAEADRLKTALLSMVSHDFRSPLASIKTSVTGLLQDDMPWDAAIQRELLSGIDQETDRLNRMVGNILALSRLEAGDWRPQREVVSLVELIGAALDSFGEDENCRITIDLKGAPEDVTLDMVQIVQVLHNLLENALKYSPLESSIDLKAKEQDQQLIIEVTDSGNGFAPGEEKLIFERFYRAPCWRESSLPGTGIGLAVCSGLVEAHGGKLTASNREKGGAIFRLSLPLSLASTRTEAELGNPL